MLVQRVTGPPGMGQEELRGPFPMSVFSQICSAYFLMQLTWRLAPACPWQLLSRQLECRITMLLKA